MIKAKYTNKAPHESTDNIISTKSAAFNGMLIGLQGGMLGGGGGIVSVPYLTHKGYPIKIATGTSSAITIPIVIIGAISYIILGYLDHNHIDYATGYVYWPGVLCMAPTSMIFAKIGVKLSSHVPSKVIETLLLFLMLILTIKMTLLIIT